MNRKKNSKADYIKKINLQNPNGGSAREIVIMIANVLGFKIHENSYGVSAYGGNKSIWFRIADHCTYMQTWVGNC